MKTTRLLIVAAALGSFSLAGLAGQTAQLFRPGDQSAPTSKSTAPVTPACSGCKDELVRVARFVGPFNRQQVQSVEIGKKHSCSACGSTVTSTHNGANEKTTGASCCAGRS